MSSRRPFRRVDGRGGPARKDCARRYVNISQITRRLNSEPYRLRAKAKAIIVEPTVALPAARENASVDGSGAVTAA